MSAKGDERRVLDSTKLTRLLKTESELEAMLEATRREAKGLVEEAKREAERKARDFEKQLEREDVEARARIAKERDRTIAQIRSDARSHAETLDSLDAARIDALAQDILDLLFGEPGPRGAP